MQSLKQSIVARHFGATALMKKCLIQFIETCLKDTGVYFSMKASGSTGINSLEALLRGCDSLSITETTAARLDDFETHRCTTTGKFSKAVDDAMFCKLLRRSLGKLHLHHVRGQTGFQTHDYVVSTHDVVEIDEAGGRAFIDLAASKLASDSVSLALVLSLHAFGLSDLMHIRLWERDKRVHYKVSEKQAGVCIPDEFAESLPGMLEILFEGKMADGKGLDHQQTGLLHHFEDLNFVSRSDAGRIQLTALGSACLRTCVLSERPRRAAMIRRGVQKDDYTVWELIMYLDVENFTHIVKAKSKDDVAFDPADPKTKVWFSRPGSDNISRSYLLAITSKKSSVPHWKPAAFYDALLQGNAYEAEKKRPRKAKLAFRPQREDDWDAGENVPHASARARKKASGRVKKDEYGDDSDEEESDFSGGSVDEGDLPAGEEPPPPAPPLPAPLAEPQPVPVVADVVEAPVGKKKTPVSSSSSSSSSCSSSSSSSDAASEEEAPRGQSRKGGKAAAPKKNEGAGGEPFGLCYMTKTFKAGAHNGLEMRCKHPDHQEPTACKKHLTLRGKGRSVEMTLQILLTWAAWGAHVPDHDAHFAGVWKDVEQAAKGGCLPSKVLPPRSFSEGPPPKRARSSKE